MSTLISPERILFLKEMDKEKALRTLIKILAATEAVTDEKDLETAIFERENILSTGIGLGIAIPHARIESVNRMVMAIGVSHEGIEYNAFDGRNVSILIMIAAPVGTHRQFLSVLARLALLLKNEHVREKILGADNVDDIYTILKDH